MLVGSARTIRGVEEEAAVAGELRVQLDAEQTLLAPAVDRERSGGDDAPVGPPNLHCAGVLLGHHHPAIRQEAEVGELAHARPDEGRQVEGASHRPRRQRLTEDGSAEEGCNEE